MYKEILFKDDARKKILKGVNTVADAVVTTLGPRGQHVIFEESIYPTITKDGVTVAQQVMLEDKFENMGVMIAREAAENTNRLAGDGTTTTVAILQGIVNEANKYIISGANPVLIKRGMDMALTEILSKLDGLIKKVETEEERLSVATISANNDRKLGELIVEVINETGKDGIVTVQTSNAKETQVEYVKGMSIDGEIEHPIFINNTKRLTCEMDNPVIIICNDEISVESQLVPLIKNILDNNKRQMILFADKVDGRALAFLVQNHMQGKFTCVPVRMKSISDYHVDLMMDLAKLTGGILIGEDQGLGITKATLENCGTAERVIIGRDRTVVSGGSGDIADNITEVKALLQAETDLFNIEKLKERLGKLTGRIANIKIGGPSETEQSEIKYRIEDALNATKSAIEHGIVEGGGATLAKLSLTDLNYNEMINEYKIGADIIKHALVSPLKIIVQNSGGNPDYVLGKVLDNNSGYNALTGEFVDLFEEGIVDPVEVVRSELMNAISTAGILITSDCAIAVKPDTKEQ